MRLPGSGPKRRKNPYPDLNRKKKRMQLKKYIYYFFYILMELNCKKNILTKLLLYKITKIHILDVIQVKVPDPIGNTGFEPELLYGPVTTGSESVHLSVFDNYSPQKTRSYRSRYNQQWPSHHNTLFLDKTVFYDFCSTK